MALPIKLPTAKQRQYIYNVAVAVSPILVACGLASSGAASMALTVIGAVLGIGANGLASLTLARQRKTAARKAA